MGAKVRQKTGKPCKTCKGAGTLPLEKFNGLFGLVKNELAVFMEKSMRELMQKYTSQQQQKVEA